MSFFDWIPHTETGRQLNADKKVIFGGFSGVEILDFVASMCCLFTANFTAVDLVIG